MLQAKIWIRSKNGRNGVSRMLPDAALQWRLISLVLQTPQRAALVRLVARLALPDAWVAAGALRNLVWDHLHQRPASAVNDIDVLYFDATDHEGALGRAAEQWLQEQAPQWRWQVKNHALMHKRHGHAPYRNSGDAMRFWPECETAIAVRYLPAQSAWQVIAPFGLRSLFAGQITANPCRPPQLFQQRLTTKQWLTLWPELSVMDVQA